MQHTTDLNCDLGEGFGVYTLGNDAEILEAVTSANIACGFHAGDPATMRATVRMAMEKGVSIGAHPGLPDLMGFGRRVMMISPQEASDLVTYQVGALAAFVKAEGGTLQHVKPHGALYNMAARDWELALALAQAVRRIDGDLILYGLSGSYLIEAGESVGLRTASEVFADRTYEADGTLTPREIVGSVLTEWAASLEQVLNFVRHGMVYSRQGPALHVKADTICLHGDRRDAAGFARQLRQALESEGITVRSFQNRPVQ